MVKVVFDVQGVEGTALHLGRIAEAASSLHPYSQRKIAREGLRQIRERTAKGLDEKGAPFQSYRKRHLQERRRRGLSERPNLRFSGRMLGDMRAVRRGNQPAIRFNSAWSGYLSRVHQEGRGRMPVRAFLGLVKGTPQHRKVTRTAKAALEQQINDAIRRRRRR